MAIIGIFIPQKSRNAIHKDFLFQRRTLRDGKLIEEGNAAPTVFAELFSFANTAEVLSEIFQRKPLTLEF